MRRLLPLGLALAAAACTTPAPPPKVAPAPPVPTVVPPPATGDLGALPATAGTWPDVADAAGSSAPFGPPGAAPAFTIACRQGRIALSRAGGQAGTMTVTTSDGPTSWPSGMERGAATVLLAARDPFLDRLAFSRGRFTVELPGTAELVVPAWAEPARVIEDCRG